MSRLIREWDQQLVIPHGQNVCASLQHARLECYRSSGTWADLGQMNRPAILTLNLPEQGWQYFLMTALDTSRASFATVLGPVHVPLASLDGVWTGEFLVLWRSEEHTSELQSLMRISYAVFCLKTKKQ